MRVAPHGDVVDSRSNVSRALGETPRRPRTGDAVESAVRDKHVTSGKLVDGLTVRKPRCKSRDAAH